MDPPAAGDGRDVLIVSNRLPVRVHIERGKTTLLPAAGGLASALRAVESIREWIGWSGGPVPEAQRDRIRRELAEHRLAPVFLTAEEERHYYAGMCNSTLWPLLHYFPSEADTTERSWVAYHRVNRLFADLVLEHAHPNDTVWVHDFHLMLLPEMLRIERPDLRIGFFLHVPFPSSEVWRLVPQREQLLRGLLGADYIGFHTPDYLRHFRDSCLRVLGLDASPDSIQQGPHRVALGVNALGPDVATFRAALAGDDVGRHLNQYATNWLGRRLLLGVERLDYTKGIVHKLRAFERLLEQEPERIEDTVMLQVLVPSREENESYRRLLREIEREVGRINGRFGVPGRMPLEFMHRGIDNAELAALYRLADVCFVAPLRDGMNLVAHEYVLCQGHEVEQNGAARGILVLSEFAGAALSLTRSVLVNPWDQRALAEALSTALAMPPSERTERIAEMYERVLEMDSARWSRRFLERLRRAAEHNRDSAVDLLADADLAELAARFRAAPRRRLFLDYDGTLREIQQRPEQAQPTPELLELLAALGSAPNTEVHVVSGRRRGTLDSWLGHLPLHLCAEHGYASRSPGGRWHESIVADLSWLPAVEELLERASEDLPGSFIERKPCGLAWHYRVADPGYGPWRARELHHHLGEMLANQPAETLAGHAVLEVRAKGIDKGGYVAARLADLGPDEFVFCAGDDRTDEDMFRRLPPTAVALSIGSASPSATGMIGTPAGLRELLRSFIAG
ncbi:MAG: bifunctional alpha,alpha-trehalose-phosphate synthase (UDP-forming)/trehalose-phosphatase [Planctomycetes bacterium]|nr:bifunctional alpha,alpha-trehalose-phosphate synthase (UDP-forming)/trehalose-phosphatase [Planctomycetota bacterium]